MKRCESGKTALGNSIRRPLSWRLHRRQLGVLSKEVDMGT
jgi:hypothetical protein